jgi:hypothetical protein
MKKRLISVLIAVVFLMVMFAACSDEPQEVKVVGYDTSNSSASNIKAVRATGVGSLVIVTWDAAENASNYNLYVKQEGKKTITDASSNYKGNGFSYGADGIANTPNTDVDKWTAIVNLANDIYPAGSSFRIGVRATVIGNGDLSANGIKWSEPVIK